MHVCFGSVYMSLTVKKLKKIKYTLRYYSDRYNKTALTHCRALTHLICMCDEPQFNILFVFFQLSRLAVRIKYRERML